MDISKIRKKAFAKNAEKKSEEKAPVSGLPENEKKEPEGKLPEAEESSVPLEESPDEETAGRDEGQGGILVTEEVTDENTVELFELLTFSLSHEEYAFRVTGVEEILSLQNITGVPTMPDYMLGITSLRGKIIPVIDLKTRLNLQGRHSGTQSSGDDPETETKETGKKKILIIEGPKGLIGAVIDRVIGVVRLPLSEMLHPPVHLDENELKFIEGIVVLEKRFISIIYSDAVMDI